MPTGAAGHKPAPTRSTTHWPDTARAGVRPTPIHANHNNKAPPRAPEAIMKITPHLPLLPLAMLMAFPAQATEQVFSLGEITVTASPDGRGKLGSESIDIEDIRIQDRHTVGEAVDLVSGVNIGKFGARNEQILYLRGFDLRQVPIYIDGIPIYVPYDGYVDLGRFTTFDLSRIEVSKGFSSTLYGANTLGGAINLISRRPTKKLEGEAGVGFTFTSDGESSGRRGYVNLGSNQGAWYVQASASATEDDYYRLPDDFTPARGEDGGRRDNSYQRDRKFNIKLGLTPNATDEYAVNYVSQHGVKGTPPYAGNVAGIAPRYWRWPYWDKDSVYFLSNTRIGAHNLRVRLYHDTFKNSLFTYDDATYTTQRLRSSFQSKYDDYTNGGSVEMDLRLSEANQLRIALHLKDDIHRENNAGEPVRRFKDSTQSFALEDSHALSADWSLVTGLAYNRRETKQAQDFQNGVVLPFQLGKNDATDAQVGLFYKASTHGRLHLTVANKSRFPTIKDRYSYRMGTAIPNANLKTEEATHYEVGYADVLGKALSWQANLFRSNITNLIQAFSLAPTACSTPPCTQMQNVGKATATGIELSGRGAVGAWEYAGNYTWLERENRSNPTVRLIDTPRHKLFASLTWMLGQGWSTTGSVEGLSSRFSSSDARQVAGSFAVANLKAGYKLSNGTLFEAGARNLLDRLYAYSEGFPEQGRTWFVQANMPF